LIMVRPGSGVFQATALVALVATLFYALAMILVRRLGRSESTIAIAFYYSTSDAMVLVIGFLMNFFVQLAGNSMQIFTSEVFPTNARASGFGLAQSGGRLGAAANVYVIGFLKGYGLGYVMAGIAALLAIAAVAVTRISKETKGLALDTIAPPTR